MSYYRDKTNFILERYMNYSKIVTKKIATIFNLPN
jgi:hypothetical protein